MNRGRTVVAAAACVIASMVMSSHGVADEIGACGEHFPLLKAAMSIKAKGEGIRAGDAAALGRELAIERALWLDDLAHHRKVLVAAGVGLDRLDEVEVVVTRRFDEIRALIQDGQELTAETRAALGSCGESQHSFPSGPVSLASVIPKFEPRKPVLPENPFPNGYREPPSEELRRMLGSAPTKVEFEPDRADTVRDLAMELGGDPMALYDHVLNQIRSTFSVGVIRDASSVIATGEGNDAEQAVLLAALFRESGFPARLAWGIQEIETGDLLEHYQVANFRDLESTLTAIGVGWEPVLSAGAPASYRLERVWCEVWLPFGNFRGVVLDASSARWLPLDPSFKSVEPRGAEPVLDRMGFDQGAFTDAYLAGDFCIADPHLAGDCPMPQEILLDQVGVFLAGSSSSADEEAAQPELRRYDEPLLPTAMVGTIVAVTGVGIDVPPGLQHRIRIFARDGLQILFDLEYPAADIVGHEATLWWVPGTVDDEAVAAAYGGELWRVPPYLINLALELRLDGEGVARGEGAIGMGRPLELEFLLRAPGGNTLSVANAALAGVPVGVGLAPGLQGYGPLFGEPSNTPELLSHLAGTWLDGVAGFEAMMASLGGGAVAHPFPNLVSVSSVVRTNTSLGLVENLEWLGAVVDADVHASRLIGEPAAQRRWLEMVELDASARERLLFEAYGVPSVSADKALILARAAGVAIHHIDAANLGVILPTLGFSTEVLDEIQGWVLSGGEARVPAEELRSLEWSGVGYLLFRVATGESRYQLAGSLSGGMTAAPAFEVVEGLRDPLQYPSVTYINSDPASAVHITKFDGDLQIGTVGQALSEENGAIGLKVRVFDLQGRPVKGATVEFQVLGGGGGFGAPGVSTTTAVSNSVGIASTVLTLGTMTDDNPYYLLFPDEEYATRCGLTVVTASVNGYPMADVFWEMAEPDELDQVLTPRGENVQALPHLSTEALVAVPADQYGNPISNTEVNYVLQAALGSDGEGPELFGREQKEQCRPGIIAAGECSGAGTSKTETGGVTGTWTYLVVGDTDLTVSATATSDSGTASATFYGHARTASVPGGLLAGWPVLLVSRRGQPVNSSGEILEAYPPEGRTLPLQVSLFIVREDFSVEGCGSDRYCTSALGTYRTKRLKPGPVEACSPDGCSLDTINERGQVRFSGAGSSATVSTPDPSGNYTFEMNMPAAPGRYEVTATPTIWVAVPRTPHDPDYINEIVPCPGADNACGARLVIVDVSDPDWQTGFTLWSVRAQITTPPPMVKLGHHNLHEETTDFPYTIEPSEYPAMDTTVYFLEDGMTRLQARTVGAGAGPAQVPPGEVFGQPDGRHKVGIALNAGWIWQPFPGEAVSMMIEGELVDFPVVMGELDVDSNNDDGMALPDRKDPEDAIEHDIATRNPLELPRGKIIFVNHNNDNLNDIPDYAELQVDNEESMVPLVVEVRPEDENWNDAEIIFSYDGPLADQTPSQLPSPGYAGEPLGSKTVYDYSVKRPYEYRDYSEVKVGAIRIWNVEDPDVARTPGMYVVPGRPYPADQWGFGRNSTSKTFWIEAINGTAAGDSMTPVEIELTVEFQDDSVRDVVVVYPVEGNLGVNNSNIAQQLGDGTFSYLRPGVPDELFDINEHDEKVEDQGDGFRFWRSSDQWADEARIEDLAPLVIEVPQELIDAGFEFWLKLDSSEEEELKVARMPDGQPRLNHLRLENVASEQVDLVNSFGKLVLDGSHTRIEGLTRAKSEMVFLARPRNRGEETQINEMTLHLMARSPHGVERPWTPIDSLRITLAPIENFFSGYSARGDNGSGGGNVDFHYPVEVIDGDSKIIRGNRFSGPVHIDAALPDEEVPRTGTINEDIKNYLVMLHGYNVDFKSSIGWARAMYKRLYWVGFRGNLILFSWKGDPSGPLGTGGAKFGLANQWALQTSETLRLFLRNEIQGGRLNAPPEKISVFAHSLGNLVVYDAMRLDQAHGHLGSGTVPSTKLFGNFVSAEAAIWNETLWPQQEVEYCPSWSQLIGCIPATYDIRELQCSSWAFWFNQAGQEAWRSVDRIFHSYSPGDNVLRITMRTSDWLLRQNYSEYSHFNRPVCSAPHEFRIPWRATPVQGEPDYTNNPTLSFGAWFLTYQRGCPAMMELDHRFLYYSFLDFYVPVGLGSHPMRTGSYADVILNEINALDFGWQYSADPIAGGHSNFTKESYFQVYPWWHKLLHQGRIPRGTEF